MRSVSVAYTRLASGGRLTPVERTREFEMRIILIAGLWLDGEAWREVVPQLAASGHEPIPLTLPGQGAEPLNATFEDQVQAVVDAVDAADSPAVVVGHSAAATLAWVAADRRPDAVARAVMIGGMPSQQGEQYAAFFPIEGELMPFPGWEPFDGDDSADLSDELKQAIAHGAFPVPEGVSHAKVQYTSDRRRDVPVTMICPEYSPADVEAWLADGGIPELEGLPLDLVDIDSGHWPMFTKPDELAALLAEIASRS